MRNFWIIVLVVSAIFLWLLSVPALDIYYDIKCSYVFTTTDKNWKYLCWQISKDNEFGLMFMTAILCMLPGRTIPLAIGKLFQKNKHSY